MPRSDARLAATLSRRSTWRSVRAVGALLATLVAVAVPAALAPAATIGSGVSTVPATATPWIRDGEVDSLLQVGNLMVAGGTFTQVSDRQSDTMIPRSQMVIFDATTGAISSVAPAFNGAVTALIPGPTATTFYAGGAFSTLNGVSRKSLALIDITTGQLVAGWQSPYMNGIVNDLQMIGTHLVAGGTFTTVNNVARGGLASFSPTTGVLDSWMTVALTGHHNYNGTSGASAGVGPENMALTPDGSTLVVIGNFKQAAGVTHDQIVLITVSGTTPTVRSDWNTSSFSTACNSKAFDSWVRDVAISPDGTYFVVVGTGGPSPGTLCDSSSRWSLTATGTALTPTWVDSTGGDTLLSVVITGRSVLVGGHERWLNNPNGRDNAQPGAVPRPGLAALDPRTGVPQAWNPGRNPRGFGTTSMLITSAGLWIGSDTEWIGNYVYHRDRVAFFPLTTDAVDDAPLGLPTNVYEGGPTTTGTDPTALTERPLSDTGVGAATTSTTSGVTWANARGGFYVNGLFYYAGMDGVLHSRTYNGTTFGADTVVDPAADPVWANTQTGSGQTYLGMRSSFYGTEASSLRGLAYRDGYLYYTTGTGNTLIRRPFTVDGGVTGPTEQATTTTLPTGATTFFFAGSWIYYVTVDGSLTRAAWVNGAISGAATVVSGPAKDGVDWRARSVFVAP